MGKILTFTGSKQVRRRIDGQSGAKGDNGWSQATISLYKRSGTTPSLYDGQAITYIFSTGGITGSIGSWSRTIPAGSDPLYVISASAFSNGADDIIETSDWTAPVILSENGYTVLTVILYQRGASAPAKPTQRATYNFETNTISGVSPWSLSVPSGDEPLWVIHATAATRTTVEDDIESSEWSEPTIMVRNGVSLTGVIEEYALSSSNTTVTGSWSTGIPTLTQTNRYLWNRSKNTYSDGTSSDYTSPVVIGVYGDTGDEGRGIASITEYYLVSNSTNTPADNDSGWSDSSLPIPTEASPYLWNKTVVTYTSGSPTVTKAIIGRSIKGNDADWLELDVSNTALKQGQISEISASGNGTVTTTITANGSTVPYAKINKITPFHLGRQPIKLVNLSKGSSAEWVQSTSGQYGLSVGYLENPYIEGHLYYHRVIGKYTTTDQNPTWLRLYQHSESTSSIAGVANPVADTEYVFNSITLPHPSYLGVRGEFLYCGEYGSISGVTTYGKESLVIDLTSHPDLLSALAIKGITTNADIKAWCDEHIPWFADEFEIGGDVTNLITGSGTVSASGTVVGNGGVLYGFDETALSLTKVPENNHKLYYSSNYEVSISPGIELALYAHLPNALNQNTLWLRFNESTGFRSKIVTPNTCQCSDIYVTYTNAYNTVSGVTYTYETVCTDMRLIEIELDGLIAFLSLLGQESDEDKKAWIDAYIPFFVGTQPLSDLLPTSLLITSASTNGLSKHSTISYVADGDPAKVFSLWCDRTQVELNRRLAGSVMYTFKMRVQGYTSASSVLKINGIPKDVSWNTAHDEGIFSIAVPYRSATAITAVLSDSANNLSQTLYIPVLDTTGKPINLGVVDSLPSNGLDPVTGEYLVAGDWVVLEATNVLYVWNGSAWETKTISSTTDFDYLEKVSRSLASMIRIGSTASTTSTLLGVFKLLCADEGFIKALKTWALLVGQGNETSGFFVKIADEVSDSGSHLYTFVIKFNGHDIFRIEPATGKVFIGSGFWYDPADGVIHSTDEGVLINSSGELIVNRGLYKSNLVCPSFSSIPRNPPTSTDSYTIPSSQSGNQYSTLYNNDPPRYNAQGQYVGKMWEMLTRCSHSLNSSIAYLKAFLDLTYDGNGNFVTEYVFYNSDMDIVGRVQELHNANGSVTGYYSPWSNSTFTLTVGSSSDVSFKLIKEDGSLSIGTYSSNLQRGELYLTTDNNNNGTGTLHIKL